MCIIIDTNTLALVFDKTAQHHDEFKPVLDWLLTGQGKIIYGGTKYNSEIRKYLSLFGELAKVNKAIKIDSVTVDIAEKAAADTIQHPDFDDQHIVGLLMVSGCKLICSNDKRAYPYFRNSIFFTPAHKKPKIYSGKRNRDLLVSRHIAEICKPCSALTSEQKKLLSKFNN